MLGCIWSSSIHTLFLCLYVDERIKGDISWVIKRHQGSSAQVLSISLLLADILRKALEEKLSEMMNFFWTHGISIFNVGCVSQSVYGVKLGWVCGGCVSMSVWGKSLLFCLICTSLPSWCFFFFFTFIIKFLSTWLDSTWIYSISKIQSRLI